MLKGNEKVLMIQLRRIGDALMCTPAIRAFKRSFPHSQLLFLTELESAPLFSENPYLDGVMTLDRSKSGNCSYQLRKLLEIRRQRFDLVIDFLSNPRSGWYTLASGARNRVGLDHHGRGFFYSLKIRPSERRVYAALEKLDFLKPLGIRSDEVGLDLFLSSEAERYAERSLTEMGVRTENRLVSISPTSRRRFNRWPLDRYAELIHRLHQKHALCFLVTWGPGERQVADKLKTMAGNGAVFVSPPTQDLLQLGAILRRCHLHLGNDNGTKHIAVAMGLPTVTVYGPHDPVSWTFPDGQRHLYLQGLPLCEDCLKRKHSCRELLCLHRITVDQVASACEGLMERLPEFKQLPLSAQRRSHGRKVEGP